MSGATDGYDAAVTRNAPGARVAVTLLAVLALTLAGCGGGSHKPKAKTTTAKPSQTTTTANTKGTAPPVPTTVTETIHSAVPGTQWQSAFTVKPGDKFAFRTTIPGTATSKPARVKLTIQSGPSRKLTLTATAKGHTSTATLTSATGKPVTLVGLRFACLLPPQPSFCPAHQVTQNKSGYRLKFTTGHLAPVLISGIVGPVTTPPAAKARPFGQSVVPPYVLAETARVVVPTTTAKKPATPVPPTSTVSAKPGATIDLRTRLTGPFAGAAQKLTITLDQGPGKTITATATVPGGKPARATITSATGAPIALVLPRFVCNLPPVATFCPAGSVAAHAHRYTLSFLVAPVSGPIDITAKLQAG